MKQYNRLCLQTMYLRRPTDRTKKTFYVRYENGFDTYLQCCFESGLHLPSDVINEILDCGIVFEFDSRDHLKWKIILHILQNLALHSEFLIQIL